LDRAMGIRGTLITSFEKRPEKLGINQLRNFTLSIQK
jgi:hypothetical protein